MAFSPDGRRILTGSDDRTARLWDAENGQEVLSLRGHTRRVTGVAFSPDGKRLFAWDDARRVLAWDTQKGTSVDPTESPVRPEPGLARSPDGFREARANGPSVEVIDLRHVDPNANLWPLPDREGRVRYHGEQAARAGKEKQHFAAAFHLGRLLLDEPDNADLKKRRDEAMKHHAMSDPAEGK